MNHRLFLFLALLGLGTFGLSACPSTGDDDDSAGDDDDATGDDDDSAGDDDDATGDDDDATGTPFSIFGVFDDGFGSGIAVNDEAWLSWSEFGTSRYDIVSMDEQNQLIIAQNASTNGFAPDLWSRFEWTEEQGAGYFCQSVYEGASEQAAIDATPADASDLVAGCGGFGWSALTADPARIAIAGVHTDEYTGDNTITDTEWSVMTGDDLARFAITQFDNAAGYAIAQNGSKNTFNADLWTRFDFVEVDGGWWSCTTAYDAATEADALATAAADATSPSTGGCGGFPWTNLTP
ncbi:MAG: hypothetical protein KDA24_05520 [Deltaproteobacteria bacterium]|nr:hypothetical protein [Deltaproteobacteria bacterium]